MPIYEYRCKKCGTISEFLEGVGGTQKIACKKCGSNALKKELSVTSAVIKTHPEHCHASGETCCQGKEVCDGGSCAAAGACGKF